MQQLWSKMVPTYDVDAMPGAMSEASAMNASVHDDEDALFDYFSSGKYAKGARTSLLFKVSHQRNNRLKTDFHDFVEANAKYGALRRWVFRRSRRNHRPRICNKAFCLSTATDDR